MASPRIISRNQPTPTEEVVEQAPVQEGVVEEVQEVEEQQEQGTVVQEPSETQQPELKVEIVDQVVKQVEVILIREYTDYNHGGFTFPVGTRISVPETKVPWLRETETIF